MAALSRPVQLFVAVAVLGGTWFFLYGSEDPAPKASKRKTTASNQAKPGQFTKEDYSAKFPPLNGAPKNAFMPIIARSGSSLSAAEGPTGIPTALTDGEPNWTYTGTVEVNGAVQALLENQSTGQGDFVQVGQVWKKARVIEITPESVTLAGAAGTAKTIRLHGAPEISNMSGTIAPARVRPPISGPIGPLTVQPERPSRTDAQANQDGNNDAN